MRDKPAAFLNGLKQAADATVGQSGRPSQVDTSTIPEVAEAKRRAEEAEALRESGEREIAALRKQIDERNRAIEEAEQAAKDAKTAAEKVKIIAATVDPVTLDVATDAANELLAAIDFGNLRSSEGLSANDVSVRMWTIIDRVRCRLSTSEVDDDARSTVLVTESLIDACDKYEADRLASNGPDADSMPLSLLDPLNSNVAKALAAELRHVLAGTTPSPTMERVGDLIAQNVTPKQIAMMVGLKRSHHTRPSRCRMGLLSKAKSQAGQTATVASGTAKVSGKRIVVATAVWADSKGQKSGVVDHTESVLLVVDDNYTADYFIGTRRIRKSTRVSDKVVAQRIADQWKHENRLEAEGVFDDVDAALAKFRLMPIAEHIKAFIDFRATDGGTEEHRERTRKQIQEFVEAGDWQTIRNIQIDDVTQHVAKLKKSGMASRTIQARLQSIKSFTKWLTDQHRIKRNPLSAVKKPNPETDRKHAAE